VPMSPTVSKLRSTLANTVKSDPTDTATAAALRRDLRVQILREHTARVLASTPPPTAEQVDQLACLLAGAR
jgi:hypothetical protein